MPARVREGADDEEDDELPGDTEKTVITRSTMLDEPPPEERSEQDATERSKGRNDHGLPAHHRSGLTTGLPDRSQQTQLSTSLVDRQRQRVGDAHQRDEGRERQHHVDEPSTVLTFGSGCPVLGEGSRGFPNALARSASCERTAVVSAPPSRFTSTWRSMAWTAWGVQAGE
jgi:hypothetical protein